MMATDNPTSLIIACISGGVSLAAVAVGEWSRRHYARKLALQAKDLEAFRDGLTRSRDADTKAQEAARLVAKYRDPLLRSAFDLQSRIYNIYRPGGFTLEKDPEYFRLNTLFLIAEFLGWLEVIRRELQFVDLGAVQATNDLGRRLARVQELLANTTEWHDGCYVYRGYQRAIGELMLTRVDNDAPGGRRHECIGYAAFVAAHADPNFAKWFRRLGDAIEQLSAEKPARLVAVQHALIDLVDFLDPQLDRFHDCRSRIESGGPGNEAAAS
jgi:hypothetical protein